MLIVQTLGIDTHATQELNWSPSAETPVVLRGS